MINACTLILSENKILKYINQHASQHATKVRNSCRHNDNSMQQMTDHWYCVCNFLHE